MLLFVGLGNPTPDSENNRHNVGFKIIDSINKKFGLSKQKPKFKGLLTTGNVGDQKVYAIKPLTFMNSRLHLAARSEAHLLKGRIELKLRRFQVSAMIS